MPDAPFFGLQGLDRRIAEHVGHRTGTFVELGAYDGFTQNNTLHFELLGWRGVLIEPVPAAYARCREYRPLAQVFNCACVPFGQEGVVGMTSIGLRSMLDGAIDPRARGGARVERARRLHPGPPERISVPARTLTSVLIEAGVVRVDLLVLDVEGYEVQVADGLDFARFRPRWIVGEDAYDDALEQRLRREGYQPHARLSERPFTRDTLYRSAD